MGDDGRPAPADARLRGDLALERQDRVLALARSTSTARTTLEREFDPAKVAELKAIASKDLSIGGPHLAAQAIAAGLVDECHLLLSPVVVGGGNAALPAGLRWDLELADERRFENGVVHLHYVSRSG